MPINCLSTTYQRPKSLLTGSIPYLKLRFPILYVSKGPVIIQMDVGMICTCSYSVLERKEPPTVGEA